MQGFNFAENVTKLIHSATNPLPKVTEYFNNSDCGLPLLVLFFKKTIRRLQLWFVHAMERCDSQK
jgi:hypothetical protein